MSQLKICTRCLCLMVTLVFGTIMHEGRGCRIVLILNHGINVGSIKDWG